MARQPAVHEGARLPLSRAVGGLAWVRRIVLPLLISLLSFWLAMGVLPMRHNAPVSAIYVLGAAVIAVAIVAGFVRQRSTLPGDEGFWPGDDMPDSQGGLYLAILVLVGARAAILFAVLSPLVTCVVRLSHRSSRGDALPRVLSALWRGALWSVTLLAAGGAYSGVAALLQPKVRTTLRAHVLGALVAALVTLVALAVIRLARVRSVAELPSALRSYVRGPSLLFQVMLLCCVPLLPLTQALDPVEIEFSWALLLAPMGAVYYLALMSARLAMRTSELQGTITELNETRARESDLMNYAALITRAQEDERRRLARDLHDDTAQALIALSRGLEALSTHIDPLSAPEDRRFVGDLVDLTRKTLESVRRACQDLRPSVLDDLGLSAALDSLANSMLLRGFSCTFVERGGPLKYPSEVEVAAYRIAQEALSNVTRHAQATHARIELTHRADGLRLVVTDDGVGFEAGEPRDGGSRAEDGREAGAGLGMLGMRERALLIGARLTVESAPGSGSRVTLDAPGAHGVSSRPHRIG
ncbi:MAG TPA: sensor histidine kinase [Ktedonobacterales bacterium]